MKPLKGKINMNQKTKAILVLLLPVIIFIFSEKQFFINILLILSGILLFFNSLQSKQDKSVNLSKLVLMFVFGILAGLITAKYV